jgi:murein DD-endopeptidase MepM/ murein hydrolase activator NlpD
MVEDLHWDRRINWSWGGLYENRAELWRGGYMAAERKWIHLGVDLNVPAGTVVHADSPGEVVRIDHDISEGGWGTRLMLQLLYHPIVLIYAHLSPHLEFQHQTTREGMALSQGQELGRVGNPKDNGQWFPHLHLQALSTDAVAHYLKQDRLEELDGYGRLEDIEKHQSYHPDPMPYVRLS